MGKRTSRSKSGEKAETALITPPLRVSPGGLERLSKANFRNSAGRMAAPTKSDGKLTRDLMTDLLLVSRSSDPEASFRLKDGEIVDEKKLEFISQNFKYPKNVDWLYWNNTCFKIEYMMHWMEKMMEIHNGSLQKKRFIIDQISRYAGTVCMQMKSLAENSTKEKFTTVELFYRSLQPVLTSMELENQKLIENHSWSVNLLNQPVANYSTRLSVQQNGAGP